MQTDTIQITPQLLALITEVDEFKGAWRALGTLAPEQRGNAEWHYVLLGEDVFYEWRDKGASVRDMLDYAKLRPVDERVQATFAFYSHSQ